MRCRTLKSTKKYCIIMLNTARGHGDVQMKNSSFDIRIENGVLVGLFADGENENMARADGLTGTVGYTLASDDIRAQKKVDEGVLFYDRVCSYDSVRQSDGEVVCADSERDITTVYTLSEDMLNIRSASNDLAISQYALNFDLNFLNSESGSYTAALLASSPYTSEDREHLYYILPRPDGRFMVILSRKRCDGWRLFYGSNQKINRLQVISSFDRAFGSSGDREISVSIFFADSLTQAFERISAELGRPLLEAVVSGSFEGLARVELHGEADRICVRAPSGKQQFCAVSSRHAEIRMEEYGLHTVIPYLGEQRGLECVVWNGIDARALFDKCTDTIRKPYHNDENLCEGGMFLWSILTNMRLSGTMRHDELARRELDIIMCRGDRIVPRRTIIPYATEKYAAYHVCDSGRIQEQFVGASILLEAYRAYGEREYLDFAVNAMNELLDNFYEGGKLFNGKGHDYTTVVTPMIPIVDLACELRKLDPDSSRRYAQVAVEIAEYLLRRGFDFPTEGASSKYEDGSISCTALSLVYLCANLHFDQRYLDFAAQVLKLHRAWTVYTPDARMLGSSFRWWETVWEGDGEGQAICAGHAWTVWKAEALYWYGILCSDREALRESWNGFVTNFAKATEDGQMFSCYEPDFIRGGGLDWLKPSLLHLRDGVQVDSFAIAHDYPKHPDRSLSRYAWVRYAYTWGSERAKQQKIFENNVLSEQL